MQKQIKFGSRDICFSLEYKKRKSFSIRVHPDCRVEVLSPIGVTDTKVFERIKIKAPWILKQIDHFNSYKPFAKPRKFISGETHLYLGRQYRLKIKSNEDCSIKAYRGQLLINSNNPQTQSLKLQLDEWYKQRALIVFNELFKELFPRFKRYNISKPSLHIRFMSKRWGSCTPSGKIILNPELIKSSKGCIEYVIIHELCHLVHHNHSKAFLNLLGKLLPDWQKWKYKLEHTLA